MIIPSIPADIRERILAAADELYQQSGRESLPTVDQVRRAARVDMNAASAVMREWRRQQIAKPALVAVSVPEVVAQASGQLLAQLWTQAQDLANESLRTAQASWEAERVELEQMRGELAEAFEAQAAELEDSQARADTLVNEARETAARAEAEIARVRGELAKASTRAERAEAAADELRAERDRMASEATEARENAARLSGQLEAVQGQNAALMETLRGRVLSGK